MRGTPLLESVTNRFHHKPPGGNKTMITNLPNQNPDSLFDFGWLADVIHV